MPQQVSQVFEHTIRIPFDDADPAGISFFANVFRYHHQAYEVWVTERLKIDYAEWFLGEDFGLPLRNAESEHLAPLHPGQSYKVRIYLDSVGNSSIAMASEIVDGEKVCAKVRTVHVFIDPKSGQKIEIPTLLRKILVPKS